MAYARRAPQHQESLSPSTRKYPLRRSPPSRRPRHTEGPSDSPDIRQVLVPLHPNLRRLPSRLTTQDLPIDKNSHMARHVAQVGSKRKRVTSINTSNENVSHSTRAWTRSKRLKSETRPRTQHAEYNTTSEEDGQEDVDECAMDGPEESSEMDIDSATAQGSTSGASDPEANPECDDEDAQDAVSDPGDEDDSTDEHLLNSAPPKQLARLRKHDLIRLYCLTGLSDEADLMTKSDIISAILSARDDFAELPPSSPPGHVDGNSSEYSSDDGNVAGGEETDTSQNLNGASGSGSSLRRRATMGDATKGLGRQIKGRSASMGHLSRETNGPLRKRKTPGHVLGVTEGRALSRQRTSSRSSPSTSTTTSISSSVTTRLRSKKLSAFPPSTPDKTSKGKGKAKQVEFSEGVIVPTKRRQDKQRERERESERAKLRAEESDLTELEELEASLTKPSPRRLRSKGRDTQVDEYGVDKAEVRRTPTRKAKGKIQSLKEEDDENDEGEGLAMHEESESSDEGVDEDGAEEEEVDELISSTSATPTPPPYKGRRTPLRTRLRPRRRPAPPSSDGDDEGCNVEEADEEADEAVESKTMRPSHWSHGS